jgi:ubiquitin-protein ligase
MTTTFTKRINKEILLYQKDNFSFDNLIIKPSDTLNLWYFVIHNLKDTHYDQGIYLGKVILPDKYPFKAPDFIFLNETGRFKTHIKICTSFSGFHNNLYSPSWNIASMCAGLVSFLTDDSTKLESQGIGHLNLSKTERLIIANNSKQFVKSNKPIFEILEKHFKDYFTILGLDD